MHAVIRLEVLNLATHTVHTAHTCSLHLRCHGFEHTSCTGPLVPDIRACVGAGHAWRTIVRAAVALQA